LQEIIGTIKTNKNGYFSKHDFLDRAKKHIQLRNMLDECIKNIRKVDKFVECGLDENFNTWIPLNNDM
jgi:hypothetical protein